MKKYRLNEKAWQNKTAWRLVNENWTLAHEVVDLRDGHKCVICGTDEDLQLDHVISRGCKSTFFETDILAYLCAEHHSHKSMRHGQWVDIEARRICIKRIGDDRFKDLVEKSKVTGCGFRTVTFQEQENIRLKEILSELMGNL